MEKDYFDTVIENSVQKRKKTDLFLSFFIIDYVYPMSSEYSSSSKEDHDVTSTLFHKHRAHLSERAKR